jgi:hypothetical protein
MGKWSLRDRAFRGMFVAGPRPKRLIFMKPEFREEFSTNLKKFLPELFPTVEIEINKDEGIVFKGLTTRLHFEDEYTPVIKYWKPLLRQWLTYYEEEEREEDDEDVYELIIRRILEEMLLKGMKEFYKNQAIEEGRDVRNAQLTGALTGLPHGPESRIASMLSGIEGKNAYQQGDILKRISGVQGPDPDRKQYSGRRKTLRRKNLRSTRKR